MKYPFNKPPVIRRSLGTTADILLHSYTRLPLPPSRPSFIRRLLRAEENKARWMSWGEDSLLSLFPYPALGFPCSTAAFHLARARTRIKFHRVDSRDVLQNEYRLRCSKTILSSNDHRFVVYRIRKNPASFDDFYSCFAPCDEFLHFSQMEMEIPCASISLCCRIV